jgi:hypothetical protein
MKTVLGVAVAIALLASPAFAQSEGRPQDGFYSGQSNGQVDERVKGSMEGESQRGTSAERCRQAQPDQGEPNQSE